MKDLPSTFLCVVYIVDALLLIALTDKLANIQPLAKAFVLLGSTALFGCFAKTGNVHVHAWANNAFIAATPALCAWSVLATCRPKTSIVPFLFAAVVAWLVSMQLPNDTAPVEFVGIVLPTWRAFAGAFWFLVWIGWSIVAFAGWLRHYAAPVQMAHVIAAIVGVSIATESVGILAWATDASFFVLTRVVDLVLGVVVGTVASYAIWKTRLSS